MAKDDEHKPKDGDDELPEEVKELEEESPEEPEEPETPDEEEPEEETPEEESEEEQPEEEEPEDEEEPEGKPKKKPSRRESLRIQKLIEKFKAGDTEDIPELSGEEGLDYEKALEADSDTIKKLKDDRDKVAGDSYRRGREESKLLTFYTRTEIDTPKVEAKYKQLNKDDPDFNPQLTSAINNMYLNAVGYDAGDGKTKSESVQNPSIRYADYVESVFELANEIAGEQTRKTAKNLSNQSSNTGIRPDGSSAKKLNLNKLPGDMSDDELDAVISQSIPPK